MSRKLFGLEGVLTRRSEGSTLASDIARMRKRVEPVLAKITETFADYTIHDVRHSDQVLRILAWLIPKNLLDRLNTYEIFFLVAGCYLHDIGMVNCQELSDVQLERMSNDDEKRSYIRSIHYIRSEKFIVSNFEKLGIEDEHQARIIGRICRGHGEKIRGDQYNNREMYTSKNIAVNVPLLAALLQTADDLDLSFERTPVIIHETMKPRNEISLQEWERHLSTCGVGLDPENPLRIIISAKCTNLQIHRALKSLEVKIQERLDSLVDCLFQYREFASSLPQRVLVIIENVGYEAVDLKFRLQEKEIYAILMGEQLYDRREAAIRELLQNSYDACRLRIAIDPNIKPKIIFQHSTDRRMLIVKDNGFGMNKNQVERYLTRIGSCFYKSQEFLERNVSFTPISAFGIGLLSCFMIADNITIETKSEDDAPILIEMHGIEDYFLMRPGIREDVGTTVTLSLKEGFGKNLDIEKMIRFYARHLDFSILVVLPDGSKKTICAEKSLPNPEIFTHRDFLLPVKSYAFRSFEVKKPHYLAVFSFLCQKHRDFGLFPVRYMLDRQLVRQNKISVSVEGVFLNEINDLLPPYFDQFIHADIDLRATIVDLNVSRTALVKNEKYEELVSELEADLLSCLRNWSKDSELQFGFEPDLKNAIAISFLNTEIFEPPRSRWKLAKEAKASDAIVEFIRGYYFFTLLQKDSECFMSFDNLAGKQIEVTTLINAPSDREYLKDLMAKCDGFPPNQLYLSSWWSEEHITKFCDPERKVFRTRVSFASLFEKEYIPNPLQLAFPKTWKIVKFKNLKTDRLFEILGAQYSTSFSFVNREHAFISLLLRNPNVILGDPDRILVLESFFLRLKRDIKADFQAIITKQKRVLQWYVSSRLVQNVDEYILKKQQLPLFYR